MDNEFTAITTDNFGDELYEIVTYYFENEGKKRAAKVAQSISETVKRIQENPFQFPKYEKANDCRKAVVHETFLILFKVNGNQIIVFDIFHGKRNL